MDKIGITTTVPIEVLLAAGYQALDLNNLFITASNYDTYIELAEKDGFPKSSCAWVKGIYGVCLERGIKEIVSVVEGDCSNTKVLIEIFKLKGIKVYPFIYPHSHSVADLKVVMDKFISNFGVSLAEVEKIRESLKGIRKLVRRLDRLTFAEDKATAFENHLYQVSCSDFNGDLLTFERELQEKIAEIEKRKPLKKKLRLGYIGVPPMTADLYDYVNKFDAYVVYNEVQREFAFPRGIEAESIYEQYHDYTYPYGIEFRLEKIREEIERRDLDGIIHYTQAFCYREIENIIIKEELELPILNIRGDKLNVLDSRTKLRLEAFLDMLGDLKGVKF